MTKLTIHKDGKITRSVWNPEDRKMDAYDVTDRAPSFLFQECTVDDDVTLRDVFLILQRDVDLYDTIFQNWCKEIVTEAFENPAKPRDNDGPGQIDYVELCWNLDIDREENTLTFGGFPSFHGYGTWDDGTPGPWGVDFSPASTLLDYPLKLNDEIRVIDGAIQTYKGAQFTLGQILYGIIWELSFFGGPKEQREAMQSLEETMRRIDNGEEELIPWEDVKKMLFSDDEA